MENVSPDLAYIIFHFGLHIKALMGALCALMLSISIKHLLAGWRDK